MLPLIDIFVNVIRVINICKRAINFIDSKQTTAQASVRYRIYYKKRVLSFADTKSVKNRTLFDLPLATYACSFALSVLVIYLIPTKVPIRISAPMIKGTTGFLTKPAMM